MTAYQHPTFFSIIASAAKIFEVQPNEIIERGRKKNAVDARFAVVYTARKKTDLTFQRIGEMLDGRDHGSMIYSEGQAIDRISIDKQFRQKCEALIEATTKNLEAPLYWPTI